MGNLCRKGLLRTCIESNKKEKKKDVAVGIGSMVSGVWGLRFRVLDLGLGIWGMEFGAEGSGSGVQGLGFRA